MKAIRIHNFGPTEDVLQYEDVPVGEPKAGEILIKVEAASLNRADLSLRKGAYRISPDQLPVIPGRELAGTIEKIGPAGARRGISKPRRIRRIRDRKSYGSPADSQRSDDERGCCRPHHLFDCLVRSQNRWQS